MAKTKMRTVDMSVVPDELEGKVKTKLPKNTKKVKVQKEEQVFEIQNAAELIAQTQAEEPVESVAEAKDAEEKGDETEAAEVTASTKDAHRGQTGRSKKYISKRANVDRTKTYSLTQAVELLKKTSYSKFVGTVTADVVTKDDKISVELSFPHSTGKTVRVAVADDDLLAKIEKGQIDFDVLVATPAMMPKLAKFARTLGPKGLMPNPKTGTVTDNPEKRVKELSGGKTTVKTEKKAPLMHVVLGKTTLSEKELAENVEALIKAVGPRKMKKLVLAATMSPGIKVDLSVYQAN